MDKIAKFFKKYWKIIILIIVLLIPVIIVEVISIKLKNNLIYEHQFWYAYLTYFGTVLLSGVALFQSSKASKVNNTLLLNQNRQNIGYLLPEINKDKQKGRNKYSDISNNYETIHGLAYEDLQLGLTNVGGDPILGSSLINLKVNGENCDDETISMFLYRNETFYQSVNFDKCKNNNELKIDVTYEMQNICGVKYRQKLFLELKRKNNINYTYEIISYNTEIEFI